MSIVHQAFTETIELQFIGYFRFVGVWIANFGRGWLWLLKLQFDCFYF
jgi:hypothetical protein